MSFWSLTHRLPGLLLVAGYALAWSLTGCRDSASSHPAGASTASAADKLAGLRLDYATYNPSSLVLKKKGWLEEEFGKDGVPVRWVFSQGSNKANELLSSSSADIGSTAGAAALLARTNGVPIKVVYVYSKPEWTALVVPASSPITAGADLKGKKVAATRGTDPFFFLLRSLKEAGLSQGDVELVHLQHSDGWLALQRGDVNAWAGLDPFMATAEIREHARLLYRNIDFNTFGTLNVREEFLQKYPDAVRRVIAQYERARKWILENKDQAAELLAAEGKIELDVARKQINERTVLDKDVGVPGEALNNALLAVVPILKSERLVGAAADPDKALRELVAPSAAQAVIQ
jgi:sulfonate transport system substrate-binding protein